MPFALRSNDRGSLSQGMTLSYAVKGSGKKDSVRVAFDPPLASYDEVKPRLMTMTAVAQEELGMVYFILLLTSISVY